MEETWKDVVGYEGLYQVSSLGKVKSYDKVVFCRNKNTKKCLGKERKQFHEKNGYFSIVLYGKGRKVKKGTQKSFTVHSLVARAFLGERPEGNQVRHLDGSRTNNNINNLCYGTGKENQKDRQRHGTAMAGEKHPMCKINNKIAKEIKTMLLKNKPAKRISEEYNISKYIVYDIKRNKTWKLI
jgi:hypothetical protein